MNKMMPFLFGRFHVKSHVQRNLDLDTGCFFSMVVLYCHLPSSLPHFVYWGSACCALCKQRTASGGLVRIGPVGSILM